MCILIFSQIVFLTNYSVSQNSLSNNNTIWKTQGNAADSNAFIGTTNSSSFMFRTNNIERMRIGEDGYVGIGVDDPQFPLDVEGDIQLTGDIIFKGYEDLQDPMNRFLMINNTGTTTPLKMSVMKAFMAREDCFEIENTISLPGLGTLQAGEYADWGKKIDGLKAILHTGSECPAWVGIGTDLPLTRLDVRGAGRFTSGMKIGNETTINAGLYIENRGGPYNPHFDKLILVKDALGRKILQLEENGLLHAREIKVDELNWPDYVFHKDYQLMPLNEVKAFIEEKGHLPNVPAAAKVKKEGINLGDAAKTSMEKIEELTLYLLEINEKVDRQENVLQDQENLIRQQKETIRLQQELIEALKNNNK